ARQARRDRPAARRLRQHGARVCQRARPLAGADVPGAPASARRGLAGKGRDVPLPRRQRQALGRRPRRDGASPRRAVHDPAGHASLVHRRGRRRGRVGVLDAKPRRDGRLHRPSRAALTMDRSDYTRIAHTGMAIMNPEPATKLDEVLDLLELPARGRVVDLGCGKGDLLARIAARYDVDAVGIDRDPKLLAEAPPGINVIVADIETWNRGRGTFDLVASVGSPARLSSLAGLARPGGLVLYGDGYWRREPSAELLAAYEATRDELDDYAGTIRRGEELGLLPVYAVTASVDDFDRYEWSWSVNGERYAAEHPDEPGVPEFLEWIRGGRRRYVE